MKSIPFLITCCVILSATSLHGSHKTKKHTRISASKPTIGQPIHKTDQLAAKLHKAQKTIEILHDTLQQTVDQQKYANKLINFLTEEVARLTTTSQRITAAESKATV